MRKILITLGALLFAAAPAIADVPLSNIPLPKLRPPEADRKAPQPIAADPAQVEAAKKLCEELFKADVVEAEFLDPIAWDKDRKSVV